MQQSLYNDSKTFKRNYSHIQLKKFKTFKINIYVSNIFKYLSDVLTDKESYNYSI